MDGTMVLGKIRGIEIRAHFSWLVILGLVTWSLATGYFPHLYPQFAATTHWVLGIVSALLLFGSVLLHELSHSFVAQARGIRVPSITLFIFGGVSSLAGEPSRPLGEFLIAVVGPATSLALAALFFVISLAAGGASQEGAAVFTYLATINLLLGLFNLVPGFPLDGGRVLRSIVWSFTGSLRRATQVAAGTGQVVAWGFIIWGIVQVFMGNALGGIWIALIGWFLSTAAGATAGQVTLEQQLAGVRARDVMRADPTAVDPHVSVQELVEEYLLSRNLRGLPVLEDGRLVGMITLSDIKDVPREAWRETEVGAVMGGRDGLRTVAPDHPLVDALRQMAEEDLERLPVLDRGRLVGMLSRSDVIRHLQVRAAVGTRGDRPGPGP